MHDAQLLFTVSVKHGWQDFLRAKKRHPCFPIHLHLPDYQLHPVYLISTISLLFCPLEKKG